ncbi:MAG: prolyl oligopeptidase family serine peptidase [Bacillota bacterium]|nr:prolyl oligopeptidase family serine peptidase [Bacillota bacterium]
MKKRAFCLLICMLMLLSVPAYGDESQFPIAEKFTEHVFVNEELDGFELPYRLFVPQKYNSQKEYPVILFLHGIGECGNDNSSQFQNGVQTLFDTCPELLEECIFILPQCPEGQQWVGTVPDDLFNGNYSTDTMAETEAMQSAIKLLESILAEYSCDKNRVYVMGLSMGGFGTWDALVRHGELFAAGVPLCGGGDEAYAKELADIPIWTYHGTADPIVEFDGTKHMVELITEAGGENIIFTAVENGTHDVWSEATTNPELIKWMFAQSKASPELEKSDSPLLSNDVSSVKPAEDNLKLPPIEYFAVFGIILIAVVSVAVLTEKKR